MGPLAEDRRLLPARSLSCASRGCASWDFNACDDPALIGTASPVEAPVHQLISFAAARRPHNSQKVRLLGRRFCPNGRYPSAPPGVSSADAPEGFRLQFLPERATDQGVGVGVGDGTGLGSPGLAVAEGVGLGLGFGRPGLSVGDGMAVGVGVGSTIVPGGAPDGDGPNPGRVDRTIDWPGEVADRLGVGLGEGVGLDWELSD